MEPDPIGLLLAESSKQLERARVVDIDQRVGFSQLPIASSSSQQSDIFKTFSSLLPGVHEFDCQDCARYKLRLAELQSKLIELEREKANAK